MVGMSDGSYVFEHRLVFEQTWNVKLKKWHLIKHINGDTLDNRPENLELNNPHAMQLLREGKSIAQIGRLFCVKGHPKDRTVTLKSGAVRRTCSTCARARSKERTAAKHQAAAGTS